MARQVDHEVLSGFIEEAQSYLPTVREGIRRFQQDRTKTADLEDARRYVHTVKGAASMVGLNGLSHIAYFMEDSMEEVVGGTLKYDEAMARFWQQTLVHIELYLEKSLTGGLQERPLLTQVATTYRRLRGLPQAEDERALDTILADIPDEEEETAVSAPFTTINYDDAISPELIEAFTLEAEDHLRHVGLLLTQLEKTPGNKEMLQSIRRSVHTLKGAASTVGFPAITELSHGMEDLLDLAYEGQLQLTPDHLSLLFRSTDALEDLLTHSADPVELEALHKQYRQWSSDSPQSRREPDFSGLLGTETIIDLSEMRPSALAEMAAGGETAVSNRTGQPEEMVRVPLERLNDLIRLASELVIGRSAFEQRMGDMLHIAEEMQPGIERLRRISTRLETQYEVVALANGRSRPSSITFPGRNGDTNPASALTQEFDDLELDRYTEFHLLSRELSEATSDIRVVNNELTHLITDFDSILNSQSRLTSELQDKLMRTRMVPLASLTTRFHRAVRVVARKQAKLVDLVLEGEEIELDKKVLEDIADPLLHILRNAVDHGIEPPALRQVIGKPQRGQIRIRAYYEGSQVVVQIRDDGTGLEPQLLRNKAVEGGYITEHEATLLTDRDLYRLVFIPGFSTADEIDEVSGRGVGLDILRANVQKLKGTVTLDSEPGRYTLFTIRLPMTLAVTRALLVRSNHETFALPLNSVTQISRMDRSEISKVGKEPVVRIGGTVYPVVRLGELLNLPQPADESSKRMSVLVVNTGEKRVAMVVDEVLDGREIVVKPLGNHLRRVYGITGATLMGDGSVVLILNPTEILNPAGEEETAVWEPKTAAAPRRKESLNILIVDDSVSVRRVVSSLIRSAGWQTLAAKDGIEALEVIQSLTQLPDAILLDIEMPRMDGYELTATLRANPSYRDIPIIMLTSRAGDKHRQKAMDLGVSGYLVKPYTDDVLLETVRRLAGMELVYN